MKIRPATIEDANQIYDIAQAAFGKSPWPQSVFEHELTSPRSRYWMTDTGFVGITQILDEVEIGCLAVYPEQQGTGIGRALLERVAQEFTGCRLLLEVAEDNQAARHLYDQLGFTTYRRREKYYANGRDALLMEKPQ